MLRVTSTVSVQKLAQARDLIVANQLHSAEVALREILTTDPANAKAKHLLATIAFRTGHPDVADTLLRESLTADPQHSEAWNDLSALHSIKGQMDEALDCALKVVELAPSFGDGWYNLGFLQFTLGLVTDSLASFQKAISVQPGFPEAYSIALYALHFHPTCTPHQILHEHHQWNRTQAAALTASAPPHNNDRSPDRRLRIGLVSPNFRQHPVGRFIEPLLLHHDRTAFELFAYADLQEGQADALTQRLRSNCDVWRETRGQSHAQLAELIRNDRIDILLDLNMHLDGSRLLAFARRPAPVQASYLAYCGTTGLGAMNYRISDPHLDPPGIPEPYIEATVRLPHSYWCYEAQPEAPAFIPIPPREQITFGCLNNFTKVSPQALHTWGQILQRVPGSRLLLVAPEGRSRQRVLDALAGQGIAPDRVEFTGTMPPASYFTTYWKIDVALDPFPYGGGTTTCDALWMGVPVVTLRGDRAVGRGGASILSNLNLQQWIAETPEQYVQIAADVAHNRDQRRDLAATMRERMQSSPLMDAPAFARNMESAFRTMWRSYTQSPQC